MILIQTYQELFYALRVLQVLQETEDPLYEKLHETIRQQLEKLI